tara:strand:+ start:1277 stop:1792 length:516 start_codon:yes stop_codon:yes gene_type:complete
MDIINNLPKELQMMVYEYHNPHKEQYNKCIKDFKKIYDYYGDEFPKFVIWHEKLDDRFNRIWRLLGYGGRTKKIPLYYSKNDMEQRWNWRKGYERETAMYQEDLLIIDGNGNVMDSHMREALWDLDSEEWEKNHPETEVFIPNNIVIDSSDSDDYDSDNIVIMDSDSDSDE